MTAPVLVFSRFFEPSISISRTDPSVLSSTAVQSSPMGLTASGRRHPSEVSTKLAEFFDAHESTLVCSLW